MVKINCVYKFRLYPNQEQEKILIKTFGCCRFIYNAMLNERSEVYNRLKDDKEALREYTYKTEADYKKKYEFLKEVDSQALQSTRNNLLTAFKNFFRGL